MGATSVTGVGNGSASNIKPLIINGSVKTVNIELNAVTAAKLYKAPLVLSAATITLDSDDAGIPLVFTRAAGVVVTLPAATGTGNVYNFYVKEHCKQNKNCARKVIHFDKKNYRSNVTGFMRTLTMELWLNILFLVIDG